MALYECGTSDCGLLVVISQHKLVWYFYLH